MADPAAFAKLVPGFDLFADRRQFDEDNIAELVLRVIGHADDDHIAFKFCPLVRLGVLAVGQVRNGFV